MSQHQVLHQILVGATKGDAITDHAFIIQEWLREMGLHSEIFALHVHPSVAKRIRPLTAYRPSKRERRVIYHHSLGSEVADLLLQNAQQLILIHHNVTPPAYFVGINPAWVQLAELGQAQLAKLRTKTDLALADSPYNELELQAAGYGKTAVLPITLSGEKYHLPPNEELAVKLAAKGPFLLFIGRFVPNKRQEDLVKLLYFYRRIRPDAHLVLVGDRWEIQYDQFVETLAADYGLAEAVSLTGKVSQQDMVTYYKTAVLYVSMSEHEGFGKPLIESMYLNLPVLAYARASVPYTMAKTGVLFYEKNFEQLAELVDILTTDQALRKRLLKQQRQRVQQFLTPQVRQRFEKFIRELELA